MKLQLNRRAEEGKILPGEIHDFFMERNRFILAHKRLKTNTLNTKAQFPGEENEVAP
jgi:hypothetical protein